jgi:Ser/Thr protein kinase RdoA (MazF antagonist)
MIPKEIFSHYNFREEDLKIQPFGSGLINSTWKLSTESHSYILQRINQEVFKKPPDIAHNIDLIARHLRSTHPEYLFVSPLLTTDGNSMLYVQQESYFRLFPFVPGSHSIDVVQTPGQAYEAAAQFGRFTKLLNGINLSDVRVTIPAFHDLSLRYQQFQAALKNGNVQRIEEAASLIEKIESHSGIVFVFDQIRHDPAWSVRVMHHDTKISNVLFNEEDEAICVIDLDTVMPGYFISDVGDMMRTYLSPVSEEEQDMDKIEVRALFYKAIVEGYMDEMKDELSETEKEHFFYSGQFMIYMQALRFLTDYLNNDIYYGSQYPGHNLQRACNQLTLLERLDELKYK